MRKTIILTLMAIALVAPTAVSAGDGDENRHWRAYPGASHDRSHVQGGSFAVQGTAARTGFALQAPRTPFFGDVAPAFGSAPLQLRGDQSHGGVANAHAGPAARLSR